jgi:hypothetical protein
MTCPVELTVSGRVNQPSESYTISDTELAVDAVKMNLDPSLADVQPTSYFLIAARSTHLALSCSQRWCPGAHLTTAEHIRKWHKPNTTALRCKGCAALMLCRKALREAGSHELSAQR